MTAIEITKAAAILGQKGGSARTEAKIDAARANGAKGGRPANWHKAPRRGGKNPTAALYKFTVVRLADGSERFTDRKPRPEVIQSPDFMVWDNRENCEVK